MSGFEVAGIVLGAFPVALEALKRYREVSKTCGFWWEIRCEYQKCTNEIKFYQLSFRQNLKQLLLPLAVDEEQTKLLLADPGGAEWKDEEVARQIKHRLQETYDLYLDIVGQLETTLAKVNKELAMDSPGVQEKLKVRQTRNTTTKPATVFVNEDEIAIYVFISSLSTTQLFCYFKHQKADRTVGPKRKAENYRCRIIQ
jgi:hypothetical protein